MSRDSRQALEPLLTVADIIVILKCHRRTFERLRAAKKFPPPDVHVGTRSMWFPETVRRWLEQGGTTT